jgi:penicillin V acylase-like amidase (Ntn superfamily)
MCTRVLWNEFERYVVVGRTMDWPESTEPRLMVLPRGMKRNGGRLGPDVALEAPCRWISKHASLITTIYGLGTADGINEHGVAAHMLYLNAADFGPRDRSKAGLLATLWGQYVLDNASSVAEALHLLEGVQVVKVEARGHESNVHLAIEDASGDSAIVEYIAGKPHVHRGREHRIMTNDPTYDEQLALLAKLDFSKPSSEMPLPGNVNPVDRFQRAAYFYSMLPEPKSEREAAASLFAIMRNVSVPFGAPYKSFGIYNTEYRAVADLPRRRYFFELTSSPNVLWADLATFSLDPGSPMMILDPDDLDLTGNVTSRFRAADHAPF